MELDLMFLKKTPPHSLEAERTVLRGILVRKPPPPGRSPRKAPMSS